MPYDPNNIYTPEGKNLHRHLENIQEARQQDRREQEAREAAERARIEEQKRKAYEGKFVYVLDKPKKDGPEIALVIPNNKLPEILRDYGNLSGGEIKKRMATLFMTSDGRQALQEGLFLLDGKPATSADADKVYLSLRESILNMAKGGIISVGDYSPNKLKLADRFGQLKPNFDNKYKTQLDGLITRMMNNSNQKTVALNQNNTR